MKKGMILYLTQNKEEVVLHGVTDLIETLRSLDVDTVCLAKSEEDFVSGWWHLTTRGVRQVLFMTVAANAAEDGLESRGNPVRLCG